MRELFCSSFEQAEQAVYFQRLHSHKPMLIMLMSDTHK